MSPKAAKTAAESVKAEEGVKTAEAAKTAKEAEKTASGSDSPADELEEQQRVRKATK